jgi:hypothetical protein
MIHRKESYRRAQQQKLTLEKANSENYQQNIPIQIQSQQRQKTPILKNKIKYPNDENDCSNSTTNSYMNMIYGSTGLLLDNNNSSTFNDPLNTSPHVIPDNITFRNSNRHNLHSQKSTSTLKTPVHQSNSQVAMLAAGYNSLERKNLAKKNTTSDSNVKLLADHNFYHVAHKSDLVHKKIIDEKNEELFKNILFSHQLNQEQSKPFEMSDYFRYSSKFKNQNQQNNSLLMINTDAYSQSTPSTPLYDSLYVNKSNHNSPHFHANNRLPNNATQSQNHSHNSSSNNFSLNLSIHTAEEFGKEMLAWLHNENKNGATSQQQQQQQQGTPSNTAATLV